MICQHHPQCHYPRKRMIQYAAAYRFIKRSLEYWIPRLRGE
jgi:hypothetical protein